MESDPASKGFFLFKFWLTGALLSAALVLGGVVWGAFVLGVFVFGEVFPGVPEGIEVGWEGFVVLEVDLEGLEVLVVDFDLDALPAAVPFSCDS